jgi:hypothetical protein
MQLRKKEDKPYYQEFISSLASGSVKIFNPVTGKYHMSTLQSKCFRSMELKTKVVEMTGLHQKNNAKRIIVRIQFSW